MGSEAPSWADQWGSGGIGAMEDDDGNKAHKEDEKKKTGSGGKGGFFKAKAAAVKTGTTMGFKWVKNQCSQKKPSSAK
ncbi:hypothetical protein QQ045_013597 [Rhodiola kirilowii]